MYVSLTNLVKHKKKLTRFPPATAITAFYPFVQNHVHIVGYLLAGIWLLYYESFTPLPYIKKLMRTEKKIIYKSTKTAVFSQTNLKFKSKKKETEGEKRSVIFT